MIAIVAGVCAGIYVRVCVRTYVHVRCGVLHNTTIESFCDV